MKDKNKKSHENLIGKIIYGFLLFMPLLAISVTCGYAMFNKNAYLSYYGQNINNSKIIQATNFEVNKEYTTTYTSPINIANVNNDFVYATDFEFLNGTNNSTLQTLKEHQSEYWRFRYSYNVNNINLEFQRDDNGVNRTDYYSIVTNWSSNPFQYSISFKYKVTENNSSNPIYTQILPYTTYTEYNKISFVSEVFYYSIDRVEESNLFNWSKDTQIYTGIRSATNGLGITNTFTPMLMTYWLLISVVYVIYDIALIMINIVHRKIHEFERSL